MHALMTSFFFVNARAYGADRNTVVSLHLHVVINVEQMFVYIFYDARDLDHALRSQFVYIRLKSFLRAIDPHPLKKVSHTSPFFLFIFLKGMEFKHTLYLQMTENLNDFG